MKQKVAAYPSIWFSCPTPSFRANISERRWYYWGSVYNFVLLSMCLQWFTLPFLQVVSMYTLLSISPKKVYAVLPHHLNICSYSSTRSKISWMAYVIQSPPDHWPRSGRGNGMTHPLASAHSWCWWLGSAGLITRISVDRNHFQLRFLFGFYLHLMLKVNLLHLVKSLACAIEID